jgi:DNA-binding NarL/FixJ family response regulator
MREGLVGPLERHGYVVTSLACAARNAAATLSNGGFAASLISVKTPGLDRAAWLELVDASDAPVLAILASPSDRRLLDALAAGARGAVMVENPKAAAKAIEVARAGEFTLPRESNEALVAILMRQRALLEGRGPMSALTERERAVLWMLQDGHSTGEIARSLVIAPVTVRTHIASIVRKLGMGSRREVISLADKDVIRDPSR